MYRFYFLVILLLLQSCTHETKVPLDTLVYKPVDTSNKSQLIIMLRGKGNHINYFDLQGWTQALQEKYPNYTLVIPDLHFGYYQNDTFAERLKQDVIYPARQQGYKSIWIMGISMGGLGAIMTSARLPDDINRLYLFSPYLGDGSFQQQIIQAGGLHSWQPDPADQDKWQHTLWQRLKTLTETEPTPPLIYLGYGRKDDMRGLSLLAGAIPAKQRLTINGGHRDWVFTGLFKTMLERGWFDK